MATRSLANLTMQRNRSVHGLERVGSTFERHCRSTKPAWLDRYPRAMSHRLSNARERAPPLSKEHVAIEGRSIRLPVE